jgi:hypothetical protein
MINNHGTRAKDVPCTIICSFEIIRRFIGVEEYKIPTCKKYIACIKIELSIHHSIWRFFRVSGTKAYVHVLKRSSNYALIRNSYFYLFLMKPYQCADVDSSLNLESSKVLIQRKYVNQE